VSDIPELDGAPDVTGDLDEVVHYARVDDWHRHFVGSDIRQLIGRCQRAEAEVKRIRSIAYDPTYDHMEDENKRLKAEVERLRGLVADIGVVCPDEDMTQAEIDAQIMDYVKEALAAAAGEGEQDE